MVEQQYRYMTDQEVLDEFGDYLTEEQKKEIMVGQEIGTRIYYGEPALGPGVTFNSDDPFADAQAIADYLYHQMDCLEKENIDWEAEDFTGLQLVMSPKSYLKFPKFSDAKMTKDKKGVLVSVEGTTNMGLKLHITIKR